MLCPRSLLRTFAVAMVVGAATAAAAGPPVVANGADPAEGIRTLETAEAWRRGGLDDEEVLFGLITQAAVDADGDVYLLDTQLSQVHVFDRDGEFVADLSREGDGPGETRRPSDMFLGGDGRVGIAVGFPGRIVYVERDGTPAGEMKPDKDGEGAFVILRAARQRADNLVLGVSHITTDQEAGRQSRALRVAKYTDEGSPTHVFHESSYEVDFQDRTFIEADQLDIPLRRIAMGPDGRTYLAPDREAYRIEVFAPDGTPDRVIERAYPRHERTADDLERWRNLYTAAARNAPFEVTIDLCETAAPIDWMFGGFQVRDDGTLWVRNSRSADDQPDGVMLTYDVFDAEGRFTEQVRLACPGDGREDAVYFTGDDRILVVRGFMDAVRAMFGGGADDDGDEPEPMEVICYDLL